MLVDMEEATEEETLVVMVVMVVTILGMAVTILGITVVPGFPVKNISKNSSLVYTVLRS